MKLNITFTYHYILFLSFALLVTPAAVIRSSVKMKEIKIEKSKQPTITNKNNTEMLHGEMLFHY